MNAMGAIITSFARHRVSADVVMLIFLLCGAWGMANLTVRFFPPFETNVIYASTVLPGATSSDIEETVVVPMENALRNVPDYKKIYSVSRENSGTVVLEFPDSVDLDSALEDIKAELERANLPSDAEAPTTRIAEFSMQMSRLTLVGTHVGELRDVVRRLESELNALGIGEVSVTGIPEEQIEVLVDQERLIELGMSLSQVGLAVGAQNNNSSVGSLSGLGNERKLRADAKTSDLQELYDLPIAASPAGDIVFLRDIAQIRRAVKTDQVTMLYNGRPSATMIVNGNEDGNIINDASVLYEWLDRKRLELPSTVQIVAHDEEWRNVQSRLSLLMNNGMAGMVIVVLILYLFLSRQVALWVAVGIPVAMFGTLFVFYLTGGTINMISMFALIMAIGIIVDDAIVVGENAQQRINQGDPPMRGVISAAKNMFPPVFASAFTTIASFLPLFLVTGPIGSIIFDIPMIIVCLLIAALIECFLVLPGHLYRAFAKRSLSKPGFIRRGVDGGFDWFRDKVFRRMVRFAVKHAVTTVATCFMLMYISISLLSLGFVNYRFFPGAEGNKLFGVVSFHSGTQREVVFDYLDHMIATLEETDIALSPDQTLVEHVSTFGATGEPVFDGPPAPATDNRAFIQVELVDSEKRDILVSDFVREWESRVELIPGIDKLLIQGESSGPPGRDIEIKLTASNVTDIKPAAQRVKDALATFPGISAIGDDTPYGKEEIIFDLTPLGRSLNVDVQNIAQQMHDALEGFEVQTFTEGVDEIDLVVKMSEFDDTNVFSTMYIRLPSGDYAPLRDIVTWRTGQSFETILHQFGLPAIVVSADLDPDAQTTVGAVLSEVEEKVLRNLASEGVSYTFEGKNADEQQTAKEMMTGLALALILIYIILTWVFNSWSMPLVIMLTMPFGVIGTIFGHWILGLTMSILSFFGMFTLMGIIVNGSIILVRCFMDLGVDNKEASKYDEAVVEATCQRLRPVLLTTITTIGGLTPLMFETSLQAQFLIPMATSIVFGLGFATVLVLFFMPACISIHGAISRNYRTTANFVERFTMRKPTRAA